MSSSGAMTTTFVQVTSISSALIGSGGIAALSLFDIPILKSQPASRSLPSTRWLFSRGSHIFPLAAFLATSGFGYLAYSSLATNQDISQIFSILSKNENTSLSGYLVAAVLSISIAPFTQFAMISTNFALIQKNEDKGGTKSRESKEKRAGKYGAGDRSAEDSVNGKGDDVSQYTDLSGPQEQTDQETSAAEDQEVIRLLEKFSRLNYVRAFLLGGGGLVGLLVALKQ